MTVYPDSDDDRSHPDPRRLFMAIVVVSCVAIVGTFAVGAACAALNRSADRAGR